MPYIHSVSKAFPAHYHSQTEITEMVLNHYKGRVHNLERVRSFFSSVKVKGRHLALPLEDYFKISNSFEKKNHAFIEVSLEILEEAMKDVFKNSGLHPSDISLLASTTVTGIAVPSLEARLMNKFEFKINTKRLPLFGLGCLAGVAGIARVSEYLRAFPKEAALFMSSELCLMP
jgi:alkylresorcinol/alkylpyrone synthase